MDEAQIFEQVAGETDPQKRTQMLDQLCGDDSQLRVRIQRLLASRDNPDSFFEKPVELPPKLDETQVRRPDVREGSMLGDYKLLQEIGEGGMGLVFMAEQQQPIQRRVAIKVIKPGMDSRQVVARFEAERQALAMMDHPNIAKVLDVGTSENGYPFFVMELVNGRPLSEYCDQEKLTTEQRLGLFSDVCRAVQHAHQKGIIHRDLKPSNILVAEYDGRPVPKVIDFGVAKATGLQLTDKTLFTEFGQIIGTIEYMSPEQSRRNQLDIDTRSDIYSLGVVLFHLLTGETPFGTERFKKAAWDEMLRIIREEEPPLPSVKVGSSASLTQIAGKRNVDPSRLSGLIRGDLDWIVTKTLEKDRNRRYRSAGDLADDVQRHLNAQPVEAAPHSFVNRAQKLLYRNRKRLPWVGAALALLCFWIYQGMQASNQLKQDNQRLQDTVASARHSLQVAELSPIGDGSKWDLARSQKEQVNAVLEEGRVRSRKATNDARNFLDLFQASSAKREIAETIEEVVIRGASEPTLESWSQMEQQIRSLFLKNGYDLQNESPEKIGQKLKDDPWAIEWADLLELWIGSRVSVQQYGGPKAPEAALKPWLKAIFMADTDPLRTGLRKAMYLERGNNQLFMPLLNKMEWSRIHPRTLSWLGSYHGMMKQDEAMDRVYRNAIKTHPTDVLLTHDYGFMLFGKERYQEAARMFHRCIALRPDVPGLWIRLSLTLEKLGEKEAAKWARETADELK